MTQKGNDLLFRLIRDFLTVYLPDQRGCSQHTIRSYRTALNLLLDYVKEQENVSLSDVKFSMITKDIFADFLDWLENENLSSVSTRNQRRASIRAFYKYAASMDITVTDYWLELEKVPKKEVDSPLVEFMSEEAVNAFFQQPKTETKKGIRDQFLMILLYDTAARVQEILDLGVRDVRLGTAPTVTLRGKGAKTRIVPIMERTTEHFRSYCDTFHAGESRYSIQPLFYVRRNGLKKAMTSENVRKILQSYTDGAKRICLDVPENVHPHLFRHSRAMHLYQHGMNLPMLSQWLGHSRIKTTLIYAYADTEMKRKAIEKATAIQNPLNSQEGSLPDWRNDEDTLKKLYGLK